MKGNKEYVADPLWRRLQAYRWHTVYVPGDPPRAMRVWAYDESEAVDAVYDPEFDLYAVEVVDGE